MVQIDWTEEAENDLDDIIAYILKSSFQYARSLFESVQESIEHLGFFPKMGKQLPESKNPEIRELNVQEI